MFIRFKSSISKEEQEHEFLRVLCVKHTIQYLNSKSDWYGIKFATSEVE